MASIKNPAGGPGCIAALAGELRCNDSSALTTNDLLNQHGYGELAFTCPHCGSRKLFLVRREVFFNTNDGSPSLVPVGPSFHLVQDWFDPRHPRAYINHDMRFGLGHDTIFHYVCADPYLSCVPFSLRINGSWVSELAVRRSAPDIDRCADIIRAAHIEFNKVETTRYRAAINTDAARGVTV